jgi:hypothetical protein
MSQSQSKLSRRTLFGAAATTGAVAAVASMLPSRAEPEVAIEQPKEPPTRGGGYQLSEHVKQYYQTTRI